MLTGRLYRRALLLLTLSAATTPKLLADATIRYETHFRHAEGLPAFLEPGLKAFDRLFAQPSNVMRLKGHLIVSGFNGHTCIFDFEKSEFTFIDSKHKAIARMPFAEFAGLLEAAMPNARLWPTANLKPQIESRMTGRTDIIQGVQAEEREVTLSWVLTTPGDFSERDRTITFDWRIWSAARAETPRVPAIREFTDAWSRDPDIASILNTTLGQLPGMDSSVIDVFRQPPIILRVHAEFYAPSIVLTARKMAERTGKNPPDLDPDAPLLQLDQVVTELSDAPVDPTPVRFNFPGRG